MAAPAEERVEPDPKAEQSHSGRLLVRMPRSLHSELARAAGEEGVSLNAFITGILGAAIGWRQAGEGAREEASAPQAPPPAPEPAPQALPPAQAVNHVAPAAQAVNHVAPGDQLTTPLPEPEPFRPRLQPYEAPRPARGLKLALAANFVVVAIVAIVAIALLVLAWQEGF